jgi:hypothetical protein
MIGQAKPANAAILTELKIEKSVPIIEHIDDSVSPMEEVKKAKLKKTGPSDDEDME